MTMVDLGDLLPQPIAFHWDRWNREKNFVLHQVHTYECEEVFFNHPQFGEIPDSVNRFSEERHYALGMTNKRRKLAVIFTIRSQMVRVISARDMSRQERRVYEERNKENT